MITTPFGEPGFLVLAGSRLYGIDTPTSDYDYIGAIVEPKTFKIGVSYHEESGQVQHGFEHHKVSGDNYEGTIYSLSKLAMMLAKADCTSMCTLWADPIRDDYGICTDEFREIVKSRKAGDRFLKFMQAQKRSMANKPKQNNNRADLVAAHGYDTKFAGHMLRLGYQGIEYLTEGRISSPMPNADFIRAVRAGEYSLDAVMKVADFLEANLIDAHEACTFPEHADFGALNEWLIGQYEKVWA